MLNYLKLASEVADLTSDTCRKAFVGAVAVRRDGVIVHSRNGCAQRPDAKVPSIHAEARLLRKAGFGCVMYVARVKRDGSLAMAKPCATCEAYLRSRGVKQVFYTISDNDWEGMEL